MIEKIIQFGDENNMVGLVTLPDIVDENQPAILILNSGLIHRIGPYRMSVDLARNMAKQGFVVFRFDLPNVGDSEGYKTSENYEQRTINEIKAAIDTISLRYKTKRFISIGLCTGAMNSHIIAVNDKRIISAVMLDAYAYPTIKYLYKRYAHKLVKLLNPVFIFNMLIKRFHKKPHNEDVSHMDEVSYWELPDKKSLEIELKELANRKVDLLYIYTGGSLYYYNYRNQFRDSFKSVDFSNHLDVELFSKVDHTFTLQRDRDFLFEFLGNWLLDKYPHAN